MPQRKSRLMLTVVLVATMLDCYHALTFRTKNFRFQQLSSYRRARTTGLPDAPPTEITRSEQINQDELEKELRSCTTLRQAKNVLHRILFGLHFTSDDDQRRRERLFGSITPPPNSSTRVISDGDLAIQTRMANKKYNIMDLIDLSGDRDADRASLSLLCLTIASTVSAIVVNQNFAGPEIIRFLVVWLFSFAPLFFVGYGLAVPANLLSLLVSIQRQFFPAFRQRVIQHEAGHFLMSHLLGCPIEAYRSNAVKNAVAFYPLKDAELADEKARMLGFDRRKIQRSDEQEGNEGLALESSAFFGPGGRGAETVDRLSVFKTTKNYTNFAFSKLASSDEPSEAWPYRGFDEATLTKLAVISVAGVCAEILAFGNAEGGAADLGQLRQIFASAEKRMSDREIENRIRFALGYTMSQLRKHLGALDAVADVMERDGSIAECVIAIETCQNVDGQDGRLGDYERHRREIFRREKAGLIEQVFLGSVKNIDEVEDRFVVGKGGGNRKQTYRLTGDDPFYAAVGVALLFLCWASSGGLSLH